MATPGPIVVIGIGNDFRSDDGVGLYVARAIGALNLPGVTTIDGVADGSNLMTAWEDSRAVFIIDCALSGAEPGTIHTFDALTEEIPADIFPRFSTHAIDIPESIKLGRLLENLPPRLTVYAIEGENLAAGADCTYKVKMAAEKVVAMMRKAIETLPAESDNDC
ncbi:MAG: hydrogenase maturation protease [candidate division Zixibacteria bacterium]|nr:hydrogenase maturation protease [candidate division Zixibacteria bacterium]